MGNSVPRALQKLDSGGRWLPWALLHYVHFNPIRAVICNATWQIFLSIAGRTIGIYEIRVPAQRFWIRPAHCDLADNRRGHRSYEQYLQWLNEDEAARKEMAFDKMCRGWTLGSKDFKRKLLHLNMGVPQLVGVCINRLNSKLERQPNPDYDEFISIDTE